MKAKNQNMSQQAKAERQLCRALLALKTTEEMQKFLQDLCTPTEIQAITDRWQVVFPLKKGLPYRTIYDKTGVSVTTIGRVARSIALGAGGYDIAYQRLKDTHHDNH